MPLTVKKLQGATWHQVYHYQYGAHPDFCFRVYSSAIPHVTVTHDRKIGAKSTMIYYTVHKRRTDSPSEACKIWNRNEKENGATG